MQTNLSVLRVSFLIESKKKFVHRMTYNFDFGRVSNIIPAHDDAVSTLTILSELGILISGSWDCSVK